MAGMGPPPKPDGQRRRTNATVAMTQLPMEGYSGPIPDWPLSAATPAELKRWDKVWKSAQAAAWVRMHIDDTVARYVRVCVSIEDLDTVNIAGTNLHAEARQLEDRLGLSPLALMRLRWEIVPDEVEEKKQEKSSARQRLKIADPDAATG